VNALRRLRDGLRKRRRFWESVPRRGHLLILVAVFSIFSTFGFLADMMALGRVSPSGVLAMAAMSGLITTLFALAMIRHEGFLIPAVALIVLMNWIWTPVGALPPVADSLRPLSDRMRNDSLAIISALTTGYTCFLVFIAVEGHRYARAHTEVALARDIHQRLVPSIARTICGTEFYGASLPSSEVGGDLVDVVDTGNRWVAYLADVSGHGVASGTLMGMFKAAVRTRLASSAAIDGVLDQIDPVMIDLRKPGMFVTCAMLSPSGPGELEFILAGHPPILHFRAMSGTVDELSIAQPPVALLDEPRTFRSDRVGVAAGDVLALVSDGLMEVFDARDQEYGLDRLKQTLVELRGRPLSDVFDAVVAGARRHGRQLDDQSLLLLRIGPA
jgi:hypothetical protein